MDRKIDVRLICRVPPGDVGWCRVTHEKEGDTGK